MSLMIGCTVPDQSTQENPKSKSLQNDTSVNPEELHQYVLQLTNLPSPRSYNNKASLDLAANLIKTHFEKYSQRVSFQPYETDFGGTQNVIASFGPQEGSRIIIGAHYDVYGELPGADDNASAVAGLMAIAKLLAPMDKKLTKRIDLVAYSLEEPPYFRSEWMGSYVHAKSLRDQNITVDLMICLEMIGYFSNESDSQAYPIGLMKWFYPKVGNFIGIISNFANWTPAANFQKVMRANMTIPVERLAAPAGVVGIDFSDHQNYWKFDYPAIMVSDTSFYRNPNYHLPTDTPDTLNYAKMAQVVVGVYHGALSLMPDITP